MPTRDVLQMKASEFHHPLLPPVRWTDGDALTPDQIAIIAVLANPALRAARDEAGSARAAVLAAGLLPNPQLSYNYDWVTGGNTLGAINANGFGLNYDFSSLIAHQATLNAAKSGAESVNLTIAWQEWQTAEAAKQAAYDLISLRAQLGVAIEIDRRLQDNFHLLQNAAAEHLKTEIDLSAAEAAARDSHALVLQAQRDVEHQRLLLNRAIGAAPTADIRLRADLALPSHFELSADHQLLDSLDTRRLDLVALQHGYQSQEQTIRAAVLNQIPRINLGFERSNDNTGVHMAGLAVSIDLPIFNRNQAVIAAETATRQRLFDEYAARVFEARNDIAAALADLRSINDQIADAQAALPNLRKLVDVYREASDQGHADVLSYYQAWNSLAQKNLDVLKLQQQLADIKIVLELASGWYFTDPMPTTNPTTQPLPMAATPSPGNAR